MPRILLTAFEPYDRWPENSSWLTLVELTRWFHCQSKLVTRRYPVDLQIVSERLQKDLMESFELAIHLGQSPGSTAIKLETTGLNLRTDQSPIIAGAPAAYRTSLPVEAIKQSLWSEGIPAEVSNHAGTYLCNATLYLSQHYSALHRLATRSLFVHLPLTPHQVANDQSTLPSADAALMARGIGRIIQALETFAEETGHPTQLVRSID